MITKNRPVCSAYTSDINTYYYQSARDGDDPKTKSGDLVPMTLKVGRFLGGAAYEDYVRGWLNANVAPVRTVVQTYDTNLPNAHAKHQIDGKIWVCNKWVNLEIKSRNGYNGGDLFAYPDISIGTAKRYSLSEIKEFVLVVIDVNSLEMRFCSHTSRSKWITTQSSRCGNPEQDACAIPTTLLHKDLKLITNTNTCEPPYEPLVAPVVPPGMIFPLPLRPQRRNLPAKNFTLVAF